MLWLGFINLAQAEGQPILLVTLFDSSTPAIFSRQDIEKLSSVVIDAVPEHTHQKSRYRCVNVVNVLSGAGLKLSEMTRQQKMKSRVVVSGSDGYEVAYAWGEVDPEYANDPAMLCYQRDGHSLTDHEGELRMIARKDKKHARWVRQVINISYGV